MKTTVIVRKEDDGYSVTVSNVTGTVATISNLGEDDYNAASVAADAMARHGVGNYDGGELMAPDPVMALVPEHLRKVDATPLRLRYSR